MALAGVILSLIGAPRAAEAQRIAPGYLQGTSSVVSHTPGALGQAVAPNDGGMILGGLVGGTIGFFAGGFLGAAIATDRNCGDFCGLEGAVWGAAAGVSALIPLGVHVANRGRGNFAPSLGASLAIGLAGTGIAFAMNNAVPLLFIPVAQLITSVAIEHHSSTRSP
jgi:hypothetical protein